MADPTASRRAAAFTKSRRLPPAFWARAPSRLRIGWSPRSGEMSRIRGYLADAWRDGRPSDRADQLVSSPEARLTEARTGAERLAGRPRVFFEEWDDPLISGIGWVSELVEIARRVDIVADRAIHASARDRATKSPVSLAALGADPRKSGGLPRSSRSPAASTLRRSRSPLIGQD